MPKQEGMQMVNVRYLLAPLALATAAFAIGAQAQSPSGGGVQLVNVAQKEVEVEEAGRRVRKLVEPGKMVPGDEVVYTISYVNKGAKPAERVAVVNPVPQHTKFRAGSAEGANTEIAYSVDGGKTYAAPEKLTVATRDAKGTPLSRPAVAADFTHIRWTLKEPLAPGAGGYVRFRTVIE
jgi:uncharacterized repeat protein (TIGR01451 family)